MSANVPLQFDFNKAVADARRDYPAETASTTFVDFAAPDALAQVEAWFKKVLKADGITEEYLKETEASIKAAAQSICSPANGAGFSATIPVQGGTFSLLGMDTQLPRPGVLLNLRFAFNHELGHIVVPNGHGAGTNTSFSPANNLDEEEVADIFSVLRGLKQGLLSKADIEALIVERMMQNKDGIHDTTKALADVFVKLDEMDVASLTPEKVKQQASQYGRRI